MSKNDKISKILFLKKSKNDKITKIPKNDKVNMFNFKDNPNTPKFIILKTLIEVCPTIT